MRRIACWLLALSFCLLTTVCRAQRGTKVPDTGWPTYGGDPGGQRYTPSAQITRENVHGLVPAWTFHTGAIRKGREGSDRASFEATPILFGDSLYLSSPYDEVFSLDPLTGKQRWKYDPVLRRNLSAGILTSRGVAAWQDNRKKSGAPCTSRIFVATFDTRLIALDAKDGQPCSDFGKAGEIDLSKDVFFQQDAPYYNSSPPTVIGNVVVVGSGIVDNTRVSLESGVVRAFDCRTGALVWAWDPIPWAKNQKLRTGAANAWSIIAADPEHDLVFVPTGAPSPDFYGGGRPGDDRDANSVVALQASTGRRVWAFQVVHHDLWDYDVASEPLLFTFRGKVPAIAITTKQGLVFVLNRLTGEPLYPVQERPVPASDVPGETAFPTQPFQDLPTLAPISFPPGAMLGADEQDDRECRALLTGLRYDGIYTPPSLRGSAFFPGNLGGVNWGSAALDPVTGILYANTNRYAYSVKFTPRSKASHRWAGVMLWTHGKRLIALAFLVLLAIVLLIGMVRRRSLYPGTSAIATFCMLALIAGSAALYHRHRQRMNPVSRGVEHFGRESGEQEGTPFTVLREQIIAPTSRHPCTPLPWGAVSAINLNTGKAEWQTPLGTVIPGRHTGTVNLGGDLVTGSGLVFTAASEEPLLRAFDAASGAELWTGALPVPAQATPMSYTLGGKQFIVIAAGGHGLFGTPVSDAVVAFALPDAPVSNPTR